MDNEGLTGSIPLTSERWPSKKYMLIIKDHIYEIALYNFIMIYKLLVDLLKNIKYESQTIQKKKNK